MRENASFLSICMNPTLQKTLVLPQLVKDTVNRTGEYRFDVSGKGINVSRVLTQLGKDCLHLTQLGGILRPLFLELCGRDNLKIEWVESDSPIRFCYTVIEKTNKIVTEIVEEAERVGEGTEKRLFEKFSTLVGKCTTLVISGTKAAGFSDALIPQIVAEARAQDCRIILDVRGNDLLNSLSYGPDIIKPNLYEFFTTFAPEFVSNNSISGSGDVIREKAEKIWAGLHERFPGRLVLTRGADSVWYTENEKLLEYKFEPVRPLNTIGSGDAFSAGLAAALEDGASLREAISEGARCGALNAGLLRPGVIK